MVAIIHEGKTDREFFTTLLDSYALPSSESELRYYNFEGIDNIFKLDHDYYNEIEADNIISKILIVIDADNKYKEHEKKLKTLIEDLSFDSIDIDYFIMADEYQQGNLESFLLSVLDDEQKKCIKEFRKCYKYDLSDKWAYGTFYKHKKHPFDFKHKYFNDLKEKLFKLFEA